MSGKKKKRRRNSHLSRGWKIFLLLLAGSLLLSAFIFSILRWNSIERDKRMKRNYPLLYQQDLLAVSEKNGLDPYLVAAVIHTESTFRKDAVSPVGAVGLMQILPDTGAWLWTKFSFPESYDPAVLTDPRTNMELGCWYLRYLLNRYDGQLTEALTAYNAGQGTVDKWLQDDQYSQDGKTLSVIPGNNAASYAGKVLSAYEIYKTYYQDILGPVPVPD